MLALLITLYTMGPGDELFSKFGHAAICVEQRCYNYGTADFDTPLPLGWNFIRGRAKFWVSVAPEQHMLSYYRKVDRTIWRQRLQLDDANAKRLADALEASTAEGVRYYRYHHFDDNCTTRIRDIVDASTNGALRRDSSEKGATFRQWARMGFAGNVGLLAVTESLLGHPSDRPTDRWSAMFLPSELRSEVERKLGGKPEELYTRKRPVQLGPTWLGHAAFVAAGALIAALMLALRRRRRAALAIAAVPLGLVGLVLWALAALSTFPELTRNELLLVFWPTDLALPWWPKRYVLIRLAAIALFVLLHAWPFTQPLSPALLALLPLAVASRLR